ncbi:MAG TPA: carboxypeptidase regulatory-like domain-containing protein [Vicinamibacterales bacterium]|nr:carboxypeptidase regulatory-like domain-containing protein [Vicinamibacterales bacterium]
MQRRFGSGLLLLSGLLILPAVASAQSQMTGQVRDESGGVLPGVTVEAASPVLIEKQKTAITDDQGRYTIVDLRPGTYKVTFTLTGFSTVVRDAVELPANFVATINAELKVGSLAETITVTGQTPLVDVTQAARTQTLSRDVIDTLPTTRHIMSYGNMVAGVRFGTPDIGGSRQMEQTLPRVHGVSGDQAQEHIDGMSITSQEANLSQSYVNDALVAEVSVTTSAMPAEVQGAGMRTNMIPKDGGNTVSGAAFVGGSKAAWQANNIDAYLLSQNITRGNGIAHIQTFNGSLGGPVMKDRLWYFIAVRHASTDEVVANTPQHITLQDGTDLRSTVDQYIRDALGRLTFQINPTNKLAVFFGRTFKRKGHDFGTGTDPRAGSYRDPRTGHYAVGQGKYTNTLTNRLLLEVGYSSAYNHVTINNRPESDPPNYLPDGQVNPVWLAYGARTDTANNINPLCAYPAGCLKWVSNGQDQRTEATAYRIGSALSYVTGTHNFKAGYALYFGPTHTFTTRNADLQENYNNGKPNSVTVYSTPNEQFIHLKYDLGYYVQDSWTIKRLTLNPGLRIDNFNSYIQATINPAGRFVPFRYFPERDNVPNWNNDLAPRVSAAYDLFGDGKTAIKASFSKYYQVLTALFGQTYAPSTVSESRNWFDCDINAAGTACSGVNLPTNGDGIAQANEIAPGSASFGLVPNTRDFDPNIKRQGNREVTAIVSHQLTSRVSVTAGYYHRTYQDIQLSDRTQITNSDYTSFTIPMPDVSHDPTLTASVINPAAVLTVYNLNPAKRSAFTTPIVDKNVPAQSIYNGFDLSFQARPLQGSTVFGSWTTERNISKFCVNDDDPNGLTASDLYTGATITESGPFCDWSKFPVPFQNEFKLAGSYPFPYGVDISGILQSYAGTMRTITYQPPATAFPGGRTNAETLVVNAPGSLYYPRYNELDLTFKKNFRAGRKTFSGQVDLFNALNNNAIFARTSSVGASLGYVTTILQGRLMRLAFQMKF